MNDASRKRGVASMGTRMPERPQTTEDNALKDSWRQVMDALDTLSSLSAVHSALTFVLAASAKLKYDKDVKAVMPSLVANALQQATAGGGGIEVANAAVETLEATLLHLDNFNQDSMSRIRDLLLRLLLLLRRKKLHHSTGIARAQARIQQELSGAMKVEDAWDVLQRRALRLLGAAFMSKQSWQLRCEDFVKRESRVNAANHFSIGLLRLAHHQQ